MAPLAVVRPPALVAPRPRAAVDAVPGYRPGRSAEVAMADHGIDHAIKLASNEAPYGPLPAAVAAIREACAVVHRYPDHRAMALREALACHLGVTSARVAVGCGSVGLLQQLCLTYAGPGSEVVFSDVSFEAYPVFAALVGARGIAVPLQGQTIDARAMARALTPRARLVLLANPNNPTGTGVRTVDLLALADALPSDCLLVVDEAYREFVTDADVPDAHALLGDRPNVAVLRTFSKAYGLAALRVGYLVAHPDVVTAVDKTLAPFAVNTIGQHAALASLGARQELSARLGAVVRERARLCATLAGLGYAVPDAQANFVWLPAGPGALDLATALERGGIVTRPFADRGVRVTVGTPQENDAFVRAFTHVAARLDIRSSWELPAGAADRRRAVLLERSARY